MIEMEREFENYKKLKKNLVLASGCMNADMLVGVILGSLGAWHHIWNVVGTLDKMITGFVWVVSGSSWTSK